MLESIIRTFKIFAILLIFAAPALAPEIAIALSVVGWGAVYLFLAIAAMFHSVSADLPWMITDPEFSATAMIIFAVLLGLINGPQGSLAMLFAWGPALMLGSYMGMLGLAVDHEHGWRGWVYDNYNDPGCELTSEPSCMYTPLGGRQLPSFVAERNNLDNVQLVVPY